MLFVKKYHLPLYVILCVFVFSCKKTEDDTPPTISFQTPLENQSFNVFDVVPVKAKVSDDKKISSVVVNLLDNNHDPVHVALPVNVSSSPEFTFNLAYYLDNVHLLSGIYYVQVAVSDGENTSRKAQQIYIIETPRVLKGVYIATNPTTVNTLINKLDTITNAFSLYKSFSGDVSGLEANDYFQFIYKCGSINGTFSGIDATYDLVDFNVNPVVSSNPYFTGYYATPKTNYVSLKTGYVRGYDYRGNITYGATAVSGYYPLHSIENSNYLVSEQKEAALGNNLLVTYYPTGSIQQQKALGQDLVAMYQKDETSVFLFGNNSGQGMIQLFDRLNNNIWDPYPFSLATGSILSVAQISSTVYLIAHSNGTIYKYDYQISSVTPYVSGYTVVQMRYDPVNNHLYVAEDGMLTVLNYTSLSIVRTVPSSEHIRAFCLLYNR